MGDEQSGADQAAQPAGGIQFDQAEFSGGQARKTCSACKTSIADVYYEVNGAVMCTRCQDQVTTALGGRVPRELFFRAFMYGGAAAFAGALLWYLVAKVFGIELGLIAIAVGVAVGFAVKKGSGDRGGRGFQIMAVIMTYLSIATANVPFVVEGLMQARDQPADADGTSDKPDGAGDTVVSEPDAASSAPAAANGKPANPFVAPIMFGGIAFGLSLALPFLQGFENIIGLFIIGIALWEAWRLTRKTEVQVVGPYRLAPSPVPDPQEG